jgi:excisionase family DNA binding protein
MEDMLTPQQAAEALTKRGVRTSARTIRRWVANGSLRSIALPNGRNVIPASAIDALLATEPAEAAS